MFNNFFFRKSCPLWDNVEKCGGARQAKNVNMVHARWVLDKQGYTGACRCTRPQARAPTYTHINMWSLLFFTAAVVSRTRHVALYVHCLPSFILKRMVLEALKHVFTSDKCDRPPRWFWQRVKSFSGQKTCLLQKHLVGPRIMMGFGETRRVYWHGMNWTLDCVVLWPSKYANELSCSSKLVCFWLAEELTASQQRLCPL
jgi:hypothetical protein